MGGIRVQWSLQQKCGTKSSYTAVEALCTSLVCYCLYVYFHVTPCSHVIDVMSEETCLVLTCLLGYVMDAMSHVTLCNIEGHVTCHVMVFLSQVMSHCVCHSHYSACHYYVHIIAVCTV